jgi:hypothetical protein
MNARYLLTRRDKMYTIAFSFLQFSFKINTAYGFQNSPKLILVNIYYNKKAKDMVH